MRILIVEDEPKLGAYLRKGLQESGYVTDHTRCGKEGLHLALEQDYDLLILDVMLPKVDGWTILRKVREQKQLPVLMLTARDEIADRVKGLQLGADDYMPKPFAFAELVARVKSLSRRSPMRPVDLISLADMEIDATKRRVTRSSVRIDLTTQEFSLLHLLASHPGEVMSRSIIASQVWDMNFDSDTNVVDVAIRRLRAKLDDPFTRKLVHTVRGMGYVVEDRG